jgi:hypothetical protein
MRKLLAATAAFGTLIGFAAQGFAAPVTTWTTWTSSSSGSPSGGSASGTMGGVTVSYSGELQTLMNGYPSYAPSSSYIGGVVHSVPSGSADQIIQLFGGATSPPTDTVTFSSPVTDPVFAIWSLGQGGILANFTFNETPHFDAGGPSDEYGGLPITISGNVVFGAEGNGTIDFPGTYTSISWTNPVFEDWYGFTVGMNSGVVPEPTTLAVIGSAMVGLGFARRLRRSKR